MSIDETPPSGPVPTAATRNPARDALPAGADIDRGAIQGVAGAGGAGLMRAGAFAAVALVVGLFFIAHGQPTRPAAPEDADKSRAGPPARSIVDYARVAAGDEAGPRLADAASDPDAPRLEPDQPQIVPALDPGAAPPAAAAIGSRSPAAVMAEAARRSPILAFAGGSDKGPAAADFAAILAARGSEGGATSGNELDRMRQSSSIGRSHASMLGNRDYLITAGSLIPCILQTAMSSEQPGYASCVMPSDIYSDNGHVVLLEKGTRVLGEYRGGLGQGQKRLFVLWTRAVTPDGVAIDLASPAADGLGRAGFDGGVDSRFWARFGSALLLTLIDSGAAVAGQAVAEQGSTSVQLPATTASAALGSTQDVRPVLRKNQGEEVGIFVAQDFDFSAVYRLVLRR